MLDETLAEQRLKDQTSLALIEIPANFSANIERRAECEHRLPLERGRQRAELHLAGGAGGDAAARRRVDRGAGGQRQWRNVAHLTDPALSETIRANASAIWAQNPVTVDTVFSQQQAEATSATKDAGFQQSLPGIGSMYAMLMILTGTAVFITERKEGTLQRLATMPISRAQILGGKLLSRFATGVIEFAMMFGFGILVLHVPFGERSAGDHSAGGVVLAGDHVADAGDGELAA